MGKDPRGGRRELVGAARTWPWILELALLLLKLKLSVRGLLVCIIRV